MDLFKKITGLAVNAATDAIQPATNFNSKKLGDILTDPNVNCEVTKTSSDENCLFDVIVTEGNYRTTYQVYNPIGLFDTSNPDKPGYQISKIEYDSDGDGEFDKVSLERQFDANHNEVYKFNGDIFFREYDDNNNMTSVVCNYGETTNTYYVDWASSNNPDQMSPSLNANYNIHIFGDRLNYNPVFVRGDYNSDGTNDYYEYFGFNENDELTGSLQLGSRYASLETGSGSYDYVLFETLYSSDNASTYRYDSGSIDNKSQNSFTYKYDNNQYVTSVKYTLTDSSEKVTTITENYAYDDEHRLLSVLRQNADTGEKLYEENYQYYDGMSLKAVYLNGSNYASIVYYDNDNDEKYDCVQYNAYDDEGYSIFDAHDNDNDGIIDYANLHIDADGNITPNSSRFFKGKKAIELAAQYGFGTPQEENSSNNSYILQNYNPDLVTVVDESNVPKQGDIVYIGDSDIPSASGKLIAITDDGKYIVQEDSVEDRPYLTIFDINNTQGRHILSYVPVLEFYNDKKYLNPDSLNSLQPTQEEQIEQNQPTYSIAPANTEQPTVDDESAFSIVPANSEYDEAAEEMEPESTPVQTAQQPVTDSSIDTYVNNLVSKLYDAESLDELIASQGNIQNSTVLASISGPKAFSEVMGKNYSGKYASQATIDAAVEIWGEETLSALGIEHGASLYSNPNQQKATTENAPKVGDIVLMGEGGDPYHNGVVVAITDDGKYIVQEANSAKANKGGALVAYTLEPADGHTKHIQTFISINPPEAEQTAEEEAAYTVDPANTEQDVTAVESPAAEDIQPVDEQQPQDAIDVTLQAQTQIQDEIEQKSSALIQGLYGDSVQNLLQTSGATNANPLVSSINGAKAYAKKMSELTGVTRNYTTKYSSQATYDFAEQIWGKEYLEDNGVVSGVPLGNNPNAINIDEENSPKIGDIVLMGEGGDPYHNGVVVAITDDGKYVVQEASSARAKDGKSQGGALVIYDTKPADGRTKYIQKYIPLNTEKVNDTASANPFEITPNDAESSENSESILADAFAITPNDAESDEYAENSTVNPFDITPNNAENDDTESEQAAAGVPIDDEQESLVFSQSDLMTLSTYRDDYVSSPIFSDGALVIQDTEGSYRISQDGSVLLFGSEGLEFEGRISDNSAASAIELVYQMQENHTSSTMQYTLMSILSMNSNWNIQEDEFNQLASNKGYSVVRQNGVPTIHFSRFDIVLIDGQLQIVLN